MLGIDKSDLGGTDLPRVRSADLIFARKTGQELIHGLATLKRPVKPVKTA